MKAIAAASLVMAALAASTAPASALDLSVGGSGSVGVSVSAGAEVSGNASAGAGASTSASSSTSGNASVGASADAAAAASSSLAAELMADDEIAVVIRLIETSTFTEASFAAVADVSATVYDIGAWVDAENETALDAALSVHADEIADLQVALGANAELSALLEANGLDASSAIAAGVAADGSLAIFTR